MSNVLSKEKRVQVICCRIHHTLRVTPAMESRISDHVWSLDEIISLLDSSVEEAA